jgi:hypothetical protein
LLCKGNKGILKQRPNISNKANKEFPQGRAMIKYAKNSIWVKIVTKLKTQFMKDNNTIAFINSWLMNPVGLQNHEFGFQGRKLNSFVLRFRFGGKNVTFHK